MARINVYLPDTLAEEAKAAGLNVSKVTQEALRAAIDAGKTSTWLDSIAELEPTRVSHEDALQAVRESRKDFGV
ncbi:MAG: type II toxin-antitoxin system CcdA family antitoxin [Holophagales bacterium]|nr:type II toxin-antitoxin system CcdA family antitoxin [Holophagales bacterium]